MKELSSNEMQNGDKDTFPKHITIIHGKSLLYKCTICNKTFKTKSNCCYHKHCADDSEKPYICTICDRKFSSKTHFEYHKLIHTGENPFKCNQCDKSFKTKNKLLRHQEVHSDSRKLYKCDLCDRSFLRKTSIKVHRKSHTGEKPYSCTHCSKAFNEKKKLINHISSHTGIKDWVCEVCGKSYSIKWNLELHKRTHSKIRPYYCKECQQSFSQNRYLKRHMETHKNSVKYLCNICDKEFSRKDNLQRHIVNSHLESLNPNVVKIERDPSTYITKIVSEQDQPIENEAPPPRTESVIKALPKPTIPPLEPMQPPSNRISVIKTIGKLPSADDHKSDEKSYTELTPYQPYDGIIDSFPQTMSDNDSSVSRVHNEFSAKVNDSVTNKYADNSPQDSYAVLSSASRDNTKSPRCFLPKKLITASYKERSIFGTDGDFFACKSVIMNIEK